VPTLYEVIGITPPVELNGVPQKPIEGLSFADMFDDAKAKNRRTTQYFELGSNRGIYHNGWMASAISFPPWQPIRTGFDPDKQKWELYNIDQDFSQADDLAAANPRKLRELQDLWWVEAAKYNVLPLDWRAVERLNAELMGRPSLTGIARHSPTSLDRSGCPMKPLHASSTSRGGSRPTSKCPRPASRA
jgi:arylsulfatase A-like enzyme